MDNNLLKYIRDELLRGVKKEDLKKVLVESGWNEGSVDMALSRFDDSGAKIVNKPSILEKEEEKSKPENEEVENVDKEDEKPKLKIEPEQVDGKEGVGYISTPETPTTPNITTPEVSESVPGQIQQPSDDFHHTIVNNNQELQPTQKKPKKKVFLILLVSVLLILLIGGGSYAFYNYVYLAPQRVVGNMFQTMSDVNTLSYFGVVEANTQSINQDDGVPYIGELSSYYKVDFSGAIDSMDPDRLLVQLVADIETENFNVGMFEIVNDGEVFYFKIHNLGFLEIVGFDFLKGEWIKVDPEELAEKYGINELSDQAENITQSDYQKYEDLFIKYPIFEIDKRLPSEKVDGVDTFHYSYTINKENLNRFLTESLVEYNTDLSDEEIQALNDVVKDTVNDLEFSKGEVWISKGDYYLVKLTYDINYSGPSGQQSIISSGNISFKDHNKQNLVQVPTEYRSIDEVLEELNEFMQLTPLESGRGLDGSEELDEGYINVEDVDDLPPNLLPTQDYLLPN